MVLDLDLFRADKGADIDKMKRNQQFRFKQISKVDQVVEADKLWRECHFKMYADKKLKNVLGFLMELLMTNLNPDERDELMAMAECPSFAITNEGRSGNYNFLYVVIMRVKKIDLDMPLHQVKIDSAETVRNNALSEIGNILHPSVPISDNENDNRVEFEWGDTSTRKRYSHYDLILMIDGVELDKGKAVARGRGFSLKGPAVALQSALSQMALHMWLDKGYTHKYTPFSMQQVAQIEKELYKVTRKESDKPDEDVKNEEKFLATLHQDQGIPESKLPIRYVSQSICSRQEVGSHGSDTRGICQFEKIEQFTITSPHENLSYDMMEEMINNSKEFYEKLGIAFRIVNIVSGALTDAASKKLDLEGWFPGTGAFRKLVSCSNFLDYESRNLQIRYGQTNEMNAKTEYVHTLNATACATTRVICAILETFQTETGITVPEALKKYLPKEFPDEIPFVNRAPIDSEESAKQKKRKYGQKKAAALEKQKKQKKSAASAKQKDRQKKAAA